MSGITITVTTALSLLGLAIAFFYMRKVVAVPLDLGLEEKDSTRLKFIHSAIAKGAMAFLRQEYKFLTIFMVSFAAIIVVLIDDAHTPDIREGIYTAIAFLFGGAISIASGYIGMKVATQGNARTTVSAKEDIKHAFDVAIMASPLYGFLRQPTAIPRERRPATAGRGSLSPCTQVPSSRGTCQNGRKIQRDAICDKPLLD